MSVRAERKSAVVLTAKTVGEKARELFHQPVVIDGQPRARRTISYLDLVEAFHRPLFDRNFADRVIALLDEAATWLEANGYPVTLVNEYCLRTFAQVAVTNIAEARRCNMMNSGGKDAVGLRLALPDDLVRAEVNGTLMHLHLGGVKSTAKHSVTDVARGIAAPETHVRLRQQFESEVPRIVGMEAEPQAIGLLEDDEDEAS
jgi:hypothetical protein